MKKIVIGSVVSIMILLAVLYFALMPSVTAHVLDTSGSMIGHRFNAAKQAILETVRRTGVFSVSYIVPFAENEGKVRRISYRDRSKFTAVESYVRGLAPRGQHTNYDEGIDEAVIRVAEEKGWRRGTIILTTDGIPDPDANHSRITLEQLSRRVPRGIKLYVIDLTNRSYPGFAKRRMGRFTGYSKPGMNMVIFSIAPGMLSSLLPRLSRGYPVSVNTLLIAVGGAVLVATAAIFILRRRKRGDLFDGAEVDGEQGKEQAPGTVHVKVGSVERRFGMPVAFTVGGSRRDDFRVKGAKRREISISVSGDKQVFRQRQGIKRVTGQLFRSKSFTLSTGTPILVRLHNDNHGLHRYFREV